MKLPLPEITEIAGTVKEGETLYDIFSNHGLDMKSLYGITRASRDVHDLVRLRPNRSYLITILRFADGEDSGVWNLRYSIDDFHYLKVVKETGGYRAERLEVPYRRSLSLITGSIEDNLISSIGDDREHLMIAYRLAEIFEFDIDFVSELREGDSYRLLVEELWLDGVFKGYGDIVAAEFVNNGKVYEAYRFEVDGRADYYDRQGYSLRKALLRAPLRFRYISSGFSYRRKHPILNIHRPHLGVDYAAPAGTPVSSAGNGTVRYAGWKGQYGKTVIIRHPNGYETYYGHLSRIRKGIRRGRKVTQGEIIGYVGSTGLSTGPHLDYRVKRNGRFINPLRMRLPRSRPVPKRLAGEFSAHVERLRAELSTLARGSGDRAVIR